MTKKLFFTLGFLYLFSASAFQLKAQPVPHFGIRVGMNLATITYPGFGNTKGRRIGLIAGVYGHFMIGKRHFSIQPEFLYSQKGVNASAVFQGKFLRGEEIRLDYFEIPILFKYTFIPGKIVRPSIYLGPYVGFNVVAKKEKAGVSIDKYYDSKIKNVDFGFSTGVSVAFGRYSLGFRFTFAALGISSNDITGVSRNSVFSIVTGVDI